MTRDRSIDALKGLAIMLVVLGHAIPRVAGVYHSGPGLVQVDANTWVPIATGANLFYSLIYSFHMPLFAFVSGYVMWSSRTDALGTRFVRRVRGLLVPYFAWFVVFGAISFRMQSPSDWGSGLFGALVGRGGLWYLYVLFVSLVFIAVLETLPRARWSIVGSVPLVIAGAAVYLALGSTVLPRVLYLADLIWVYPFVVFGYVAGSRKAELLRYRRRAIAMGVAAFVPLFYLRYPIYVQELQPLASVMERAGIRGAYVIEKALAYSCAAAAVVAIFALYLGTEGRAIDFQAWIGRRSLGVYALHGTIMGVLFAAGLRNEWMLAGVVLAVSLAGTVLIEQVPIARSVLLGQYPRRVEKPPVPATSVLGQADPAFAISDDR